MKKVNQAIPKIDAKALVTGKPVYTDDLAPKDCLIVKVLRSPHAHALIRNIDSSRARKVPGIVAIYTYEDCPKERFTMAGQTYPEPSPYDRLILDQRVRFIGDAVAIVAGETAEAVDRAMKMIKVEYEVLKPLLDFRKAMRSLFIRRKAGEVSAMWGRIIRGTYVPAEKKRTAMLIRYFLSAGMW